MLIGLKVRVDRIGKAAFLAHLLHQLGGEPATAEDVVDDESRQEVRILARHGAETEHGHRLRHAHLDHLLTAAGQRLRLGDGNEIGFCWQAAEDVVDELYEFGRRDIADRDDLEVIAGETFACDRPRDHRA